MNAPHKIIDYPAVACLVCKSPGDKALCKVCLSFVPIHGGLLPKRKGSLSYLPLEQRLWPNVAPLSLDACWPWNGSVVSRNRGRITNDGRLQYVHKLIWEMLNGPVPEGLELDHLCRNPNCVNPRHLEAVTHQENIRRGDNRTNNALANKTHCPQGHEYTPENTYYQPKMPTSRHCKICRREYKARLRAALSQTEEGR